MRQQRNKGNNMAFSPIAFTAPNYRDYKNEWLKAYEPGTTTPKPIATDSTLSTLIAKAQLNADGFIVSAGDALIIPYIDGAYDLWLFPSDTEADANDTSSALRLADNVTGVNGVGASNANVKSFDTLPLAVASTDITKVFDGAALNLKERTPGNGGGAMWDAVLSSSVTENTYNIVQCVGVPTISLILRDAEGINLKQWGVICDASGATGTNNSPTVQAAVDYALTFNPPKAIHVEGLVPIVDQIKIDRLVDTAAAAPFFYIVGEGEGSGFYAPFGLVMFGTNLPLVQDPQSQRIYFKDLLFQSNAPTNPTYAADGNAFLRIRFEGCSFYKMRIATSDWYMQSWHFSQCSAFNYTGTLYESFGGAYDIKFDLTMVEGGGGFCYLTNLDNYTADPVAGCSITNSLCQAMTGDAIMVDRAAGFSVDNTYFEGNGGVDINCETARNVANLTPNGAIKITGCLFAPTIAHRENPGYFPVRWGRTAHGFAAANELIGDSNRLHGTITESDVTFIQEAGTIAGLDTTGVVSAKLGFYNDYEALRTIRGEVSLAGAKVLGAGFTVVAAGAGMYNIVFDDTFVDAPSISIGVIDSTGSALSAAVASTLTTATVHLRNSSDVSTSSAFSFTVMGKQS